MNSNDQRNLEKESIRDRINLLLEEKNLKRSKFAKAVGIAQKTLDNQLGGKQKVHVSLDTILAAHRYFPEITLEWLIDGEEPKYSYKFLEKMDDPQSISDSNMQELEEHIIHDMIEHVKLLHKPFQTATDYHIIPVYDLNSETGEKDKNNELYSLGK